MKLINLSTPEGFAPTLQDQHQRRFTYLRLSVTEACNFRCTYCLPNGYCPNGRARKELTLGEIEALTRAFAANGTRKIRITGGEPTLRKDLAEIIRICKQTTGIEQVALTSNGYRIDKQLAEFRAAGLDALNLSADSLQAPRFKLITGHDKLSAVMRGLDQAADLGFERIKLNTVLLREHTLQELPHFMALVKRRNISLRFIELMETGLQRSYFDAQHLSGKVIEQELLKEGWQRLPRAPHAGPAAEYAHPDYVGRIGLIMPYSKNFCTDCNRLRVSSSGQLHLCLFADQGIDLRPALNQENPDALHAYLRAVVNGKQTGHRLNQRDSGAIQHLAMIGG